VKLRGELKIAKTSIGRKDQPEEYLALGGGDNNPRKVKKGQDITPQDQDKTKSRQIISSKTKTELVLIIANYCKTLLYFLLCSCYSCRDIKQI